ncbi:MAG: citramalate synthase [Dethiobacteria bacterium]
MTGLKNKVELYDTTLRDGAQREGISLSVNDKLKIAEKLDELGLDYIEGGWPGSNPKDMEFFERIKEINLRHARICAFGCTRKPGIKVARDKNVQALIKAQTDTVTIFGKCWDFHVTDVLETSLEENLAMIADTIGYLKEHGKRVIFDAEHFFDGYRNNARYALEAIKAAEDSGADVIVLCDTNGGVMPWEVKSILKEIKKVVSVTIGIHAHDDGGMAVANTVIAVREGARHVQGTINGYGERCGNANLCTIIPTLQFKLKMTVLSKSRLKKLTDFSRYIAELCNIVPAEQQPYVGRNAFTHKAGIHVDAVNKTPDTYEHVKPESIGNNRRILVSELSGKGNILYKVRQNDIELLKENPETKRIVETIKEMEYEGYQFEVAEGSFELMVWKVMNAYQSLFRLEGFRVIVEKHGSGESHCEATIKVVVGDKEIHTAADGNGPVNALDNALRKALEEVYPVLKKIKLVDYKVRVLEAQDGTGAKVRVLLESKGEKKSWSTVGVSSNIIEASWTALVDSLEYGLLHKKMPSILKDRKLLSLLKKD